MMKKYLYLALIVISNAFLASAQKSSKDSMLSAISKEVCAEIGNKDLTGKTAEELQMELGLAIMPSITSRMDLINKYYGSDVSQEVLNQVGEEVGMKLALECPAFLKLFAGNSDFLKKSMDENKPAEQTVSGTLQKIIPGDFTYFQVKDPSGRLVKVWWMEEFDGADKLTDKLLNKPVVVSYRVRQTYNAQMKQYLGTKVATKLQLIQ